MQRGGEGSLRQRGAATAGMWRQDAATSRRQDKARRIVSQQLIAAQPPAKIGVRNEQGGETMTPLLVFVTSLVVGQSISIGAGLMVERLVSPYAGLVTFVGFYLAMFWLTWRLAVHVTGRS